MIDSIQVYAVLVSWGVMIKWTVELLKWDESEV